jgi:hypothetical protein
MENIEPDKPDQTETIAYQRSIFMTLLSLIAFIFFGILSVLFLAGAISSDWISRVTNQYVPEKQYYTTELRMVFLAGFVLHFCSLIGSIVIWRLKKQGYYLLGICCLIIAVYQLLNPYFTAIPAIVYILFLIGFGFFYRRLN